MAPEWVRALCMSLPNATEQIQWGADLVFKIEGKMFAVLALEPSHALLSFKCTPELFAELVELPGVKPAPYLARAYWVALESEDALPRNQLKGYLQLAYDTVVANLPKKRSSPKKPAKKKAVARKAAARKSK